MLYLVAGLVIVTIVILLTTANAKKQQQKRLATFRDVWGTAKNDHFNMDVIERYFNITKEPSFHQLSTQTINALAFTICFASPTEQPAGWGNSIYSTN